tara:strand:+ start:882 stop:1694 length:813 start_codon:yes stop_codon:yes gene_type:complete
MSNTKNNNYKNMLGKRLRLCSIKPMTGWYRDGYCSKDKNDMGSHTVCSVLSKKFMDFSKKRNNDLYGVAKPNDKWCLCEKRWEEAYDAGYAPRVLKTASNYNIEPNIKYKINHFNKYGYTIKKQTKNIEKGKQKISSNRKINKKKINKISKQKVNFLYNHTKPNKDYDLFGNRNPKDTIHVKYKTIEDLKDSILNLEKLYKDKKYPHKRIVQVAMVMNKRLKHIYDNKDTLYVNAKKVKERYLLSDKYLKFLKGRTKKNENKRRKLIFEF